MPTIDRRDLDRWRLADDVTEFLDWLFPRLIAGLFVAGPIVLGIWACWAGP